MHAATGSPNIVPLHLVLAACVKVTGQREEASNLLHVMQATNIIFYAVTSNLL